jgi:hypothetical protein
MKPHVDNILSPAITVAVSDSSDGSAATQRIFGTSRFMLPPLYCNQQRLHRAGQTEGNVRFRMNLWHSKL